MWPPSNVWPHAGHGGGLHSSWASAVNSLSGRGPVVVNCSGVLAGAPLGQPALVSGVSLDSLYFYPGPKAALFISVLKLPFEEVLAAGRECL